jgi:glycosyltransferase involved in cell wall biosynthesis
MLLMQLSDAILFYTDREVEEYTTSRRGSRKPVLGLNNGIETEEIIRLRKPYEPSSRPNDLLFIGRITPKAELGLLLEALALPVCAGIRLDVIGGGEDESRLRGRCVELRVAERVTWHGGTTDEARIADIANGCRAFAYPGSVGLSLIHGLAYGLPAIVHDDRWTHMPEIAALRAGENGTTFKRGSSTSLGNEISRLLASHERLEVMSSRAIATTMESFNTADMVKRFCSVIATCSARSTRY